jgi:uncharacterized protein YukE
MDIDRLRSAKWVGALSRERVEADPILHRVSQAAHSDSQKKRAKAFSEALEKLPTILERVEAATELEGVDMNELRQIQELYMKALNVYIEACKLGMKQLKDQIPSQYAEIRSKISLADSYWEAAAAATHALSEK